MSQVNSYDREQYATDGVTKTFSFGWDVNSTDDVKVNFVRDDGTILNVGTFIDSNDDEYTTSNFSFVVELNRQGGTITFADTPADDQNIIIWRETDLVYENSFKTATAFPAAAIDKAYRKIWLALQEVQSDVIHNTVRMTPNQRGLHFGEFSEDVTDHLVYYSDQNKELLFTPFTMTDVQNTIAIAQNIPSIAGDAAEALSKATAALTIAGQAKSDAQTARQDAATAVQTANNAYGLASTALHAGDNITQLVNNANYQTLADMTSALSTKQDTLVSGTNIKTVNGNSLLGSGDITLTSVAAWGSITGTLSDQTDLQTALNDKANAADLALVATTGDYDDLLNKPTIPSAQIQADWTQADNTKVDYIKNKPTLGTAAAADTTDFATAAQGSKADTAIQPSDLATVATTGSYNDLLNKPTIPAAQVNSDWAANSGVAQILNKPTLGTAAAANTTDFATAAQGALADTALQAADLANYVTTNTTQTISGEKVFSGIMNYSAGKTYILAGNGGQKLGYWTYDIDGGSNITLQTMTASTRDINFKTNNGGKVKYNGSEIAKVSNIPTAVSQLSNDSGFITSSDIPVTDVTVGGTSVVSSGVAVVPAIPTVGDGTITITQGGVTKGTFTTNQSGNTTVALDAGGGAVDSVNGQTGTVVLTAADVGALPDSTVIPTVNDSSIIITQDGVTKGTFTLNQASGDTIALTTDISKMMPDYSSLVELGTTTPLSWACPNDGWVQFQGGASGVAVRLNDSTGLVVAGYGANSSVASGVVMPVVKGQTYYFMGGTPAWRHYWKCKGA